MKKLLLLSIFLLLTGCASTVPVKMSFPEVPEDLKNSCADLKDTEPTTKLSEVLTVVAQNYGQYHECRIKMDAWIEWYNTQKTIFNNVK
jgi:hypothetical protein